MLAPKSDFIGLEGITHLATGGEPPLLKSHREAFEEFARDKACGFGGYRAHWAVGDDVRGQLVAMTGLAANDFALLGSALASIASVLSPINWRSGDNVVTSSLEYASGRYAFARLAGLEVETRLVEPAGWQVELDGLIAACDARTRIVYVSQVSYLTGQALDIATLSAALRPDGIALLVDVSHAPAGLPTSSCALAINGCSAPILEYSPGTRQAGPISSRSTSAGTRPRKDQRRLPIN